MADNDRMERLVKALDDSRTRSRARRELARLGEAAGERLLELTGNSEAGDNARWAAISLLGACQYRPAIPILVEIMKGSRTLRGDAHRALRAITGAEHGGDTTAWLEEADPGAAKGEPAPSESVQEGHAGTGGPEGSVEKRPELLMAERAVGDVAVSLSWRDPATVCVKIAPGPGEGQEMEVRFDAEDRMGRPLVCIQAHAGPATPTTQAVMFRHNVTLRYGKYEIESLPGGEAYAVLRYRTSPRTLTALFLRDILLGMAHDLAQIADELGQSDRLYPWRASSPTELSRD